MSILFLLVILLVLWLIWIVGPPLCYLSIEAWEDWKEIFKKRK